MCGIAGLIYERPEHDDGARLQAMANVLAHRGPDDVGYLQWSEAESPRIGREAAAMQDCRVAFAHRRLAIFDPSPASAQPMSTADGRFHMVFNGAIYNYVELRAELKSLGHVFRSNGDTEVLLAAYAQWGLEALPRLVGMFAFAVLDTRQRKIVLARDFAGIKPLYYARWRDGFAIASEIKALLALPGIQRRLNPKRAFEYLRFGLTDYGTDTMIDGISQVPAASTIELSLDDFRISAARQYWRVDLEARCDLSFDEAAAEARDRFLESVSLHLRSDVAVGAALSGGIDSSAIVAAMRRIVGPSLGLQTFTYVTEDSEFNEEAYADLAAESAQAPPHKIRCDTDELVADLDQLIDSQDEPFGSTSIYAQRKVFETASACGIKVMLDGQGADEIWGGYRHYVAARAASLLRGGRLMAARQLLAKAAGLPPSGAAPALTKHAFGLLLPRRLHRLAARLAGHALMPTWLAADWFSARGVIPQAPRQASGPCFLREQLWNSVHETSLPSLLRYEDRNSMAFSIESRVPFLTPSFVQFVLSLPEDYVIGGDGISKRLFRAAMRGIVPDEILDRKDKIGFATPESKWLRQLRPWIQDVLNSDRAAAIPAIRADVMRHEWEDFVRSGRQFDFRFWRWVNFIRWVEQRDIIVE